VSRAGIAPSVLLQQIEAACPWALDPAYAGGLPAAGIARGADLTRDAWESDPRALDYFRLLLSAHYLTVGSFCPTDVDARIRAHQWTGTDEERVLASLPLVDEAAGWDPRPVSARVVAADGEAPLSGHDGEWLSVRAGALGRVIELGHDAARASLAEAIDAELDREARVVVGLARGGPPLAALSAVTAIAHNLGDLSRVVAEWPRGGAHGELAARWLRLGHPDAPPAARARFGDVFVKVGELNKRLTAQENHRFLALRGPKGLRKDRALLLPIGPFFFDWGRTVARHPALEHRDRAEVLGALLETHVRGETQEGCLRAIAGLHEATAGGVEALAPDVPARLRKLVFQGAVRDALRTSEETFTGRLAARFRKEVAALGGLAVVALLALGCDREAPRAREALTPSASAPASSTASAPASSTASGGAPSSAHALAASSAGPPTPPPPTAKPAWVLPADGVAGFHVALVEDSARRARASIDKAGRAVAEITVEPASPRDAGVAGDRVNGHPVYASKDATVLATGEWDLTVTSASLDRAGRKEWLLRCDVNALSALAPVVR